MTINAEQGQKYVVYLNVEIYDAVNGLMRLCFFFRWLSSYSVEFMIQPLFTVARTQIESFYDQTEHTQKANHILPLLNWLRSTLNRQNQHQITKFNLTLLVHIVRR